MKLKTKYIVMVAVVAMVIMVDLITKYCFGGIKFTKVIPYLFDFESNHGNDGAAFGILGGKRFFLIILTLVFIALIIVYDTITKSKSKLYTVGISFVLGGAIGNLVDRIWLGYVRDFIKFDFWKSFPTFNFADTFLCIGIALICMYVIFHKTSEKNENKNS